MSVFSQLSKQAIERIRELVDAGGCDLHLHTHCSDGSDSPQGLVNRVIDSGLKAFAVTDHDTLSAVEPVQAALDAHALETGSESIPVVIPGVELSVDDGQELHLLGYFPFGGEAVLETFLHDQRVKREARNQQMLERLAALGYPIEQSEFQASGEEVLGRMQIALLLVKDGYFSTVSDVFNHLIGEGKPGYLERTRPSIEDAIQAIRIAGGAAVLAHPALYGWCGEGPFIQLELIHRLRYYHSIGLQGVEAYHGEASPECQTQVAAGARIVGLVTTCGSDDHGKHKLHAQMYQGSSRFGKHVSVLVTAALIEGQTVTGKQGWMLTRRSGQRRSAGLWEFPGGKVEPDEAPESCLERELLEELKARASIGALGMALHHDYDDLQVVLLCYKAVLIDSPVLDPEVHDAICYATLQEARDFDLLGADYFVIDELERQQGAPS